MARVIGLEVGKLGGGETSILLSAKLFSGKIQILGTRPLRSS